MQPFPQRLKKKKKELNCSFKKVNIRGVAKQDF